jgi:hypothetical protein
MTSKAPAIIAVQDLNSISPAEAVAKAKEDTLKQASAARVPDQDILENQRMAAEAGYWLDWNEVISASANSIPRFCFSPAA